MIHDALRLLVNELNDAFGGAGGAGDAVTLGNIALMDGDQDAQGGGDLRKIVLSLVNVTEDQTLKNGPHHRLRDGRVIYENRPVNLYLYLLFSANDGVYSTALNNLSRLIQFFQGKSVFTLRNSPDTSGLLAAPEDLAGLRMILELHSLTFEQINHLWGSLGGKQVPFVMYRARLLSLTADEILGRGDPITDIELHGTDLHATTP